MEDDYEICRKHPQSPFDVPDDDEVFYPEPLDLKLTQVSTEAVAEALTGFNLPLASGKDLSWLAMAVRRSLGIAIMFQRPMESSSEIRTELRRLAGLAETTWMELFRYRVDIDRQLTRFAYLRDYDENLQSLDNDSWRAPKEYSRYNTAIAELNWLGQFLRSAADATRSQAGPWRQSEERRRRIERGHFLALVFESAYGVAVSANNFPNDPRHNLPTAFMDFYQRMVKLAFGENVTPDLSGVLKASCQLHRNNPVQLAEGVIPNL